MYNVIGTNNPTYLLADPQGADLIAIPCEPGNGTVKRGTIMYRKSSGMYAPAATGDVVITNNLAVLDEEVNTDASMTIAEDARAYRAGRLVAGKVTLKSDGTVTAAHALVLRNQGIMLDRMENTSTFDNERSAITYKANNNAETPEADIVVYEDSGATHTIKSVGSSTGNANFTAPSGKSFSKWNTNADGTGTDYAAAASYTANASLTLYAIWA
ncbi:MAG: InlB B-repeat-containing protein [Eubacteriales bacterium]|nr:InlB B-repeat-containing protein [Eubacteriales bacterium]MDD4513736.1 InlB B-repeat-containing protein [Eubacteriales bacterium]